MAGWTGLNGFVPSKNGTAVPGERLHSADGSNGFDPSRREESATPAGQWPYSKLRSPESIGFADCTNGFVPSRREDAVIPGSQRFDALRRSLESIGHGGPHVGFVPSMREDSATPAGQRLDSMPPGQESIGHADRRNGFVPSKREDYANSGSRHLYSTRRRMESTRLLTARMALFPHGRRINGRMAASRRSYRGTETSDANVKEHRPGVRPSRRPIRNAGTRPRSRVMI
jgi:hypothetical protein